MAWRCHAAPKPSPLPRPHDPDLSLTAPLRHSSQTEALPACVLQHPVSTPLPNPSPRRRHSQRAHHSGGAPYTGANVCGERSMLDHVHPHRALRDAWRCHPRSCVTDAPCEHERHTHRRSAGPLRGGEPRDIDERWGRPDTKGWAGGLDGIEDRVDLTLQSGLLVFANPRPESHRWWAAVLQKELRRTFRARLDERRGLWQSGRATASICHHPHVREEAVGSYRAQSGDTP